MAAELQENELSLIQMVIFIEKKIVHLSLADRKEILKMIVNSVDDNKIRSKGTGTQVKIEHLAEKGLVEPIYKYIKSKIDDQMEQLKDLE
jgi:hypothetical protein